MRPGEQKKNAAFETVNSQFEETDLLSDHTSKSKKCF